MTARDDLNLFASAGNRSQVLRDIVAEVLIMEAKVTNWTIVPTSGSAVCRYNTTTGWPNSYEVRAQEGNVGNIVHELIHVAANESYVQDFIDYQLSTVPMGMPARMYSTAGYCTNEEARQMKYFSNDAGNVTDHQKKLAELTTWADSATELSSERRKEIKDKFSYGNGTPHKEYDTVITQVLVWVSALNYPTAAPTGGWSNTTKKPVVNALYEEVEKAAKAAYDKRHNARTLMDAKRLLGNYPGHV